MFTLLAAALSLLLFTPALADRPKIGLLLKGRSNFWTAVETGARRAAEADGAELIVKAPLSENDISIQSQLLNAFASQGVAAVIVAPGHPSALNETIAAQEARGLKIVIIDSPLADRTPTAFIGTDHAAAGEAAGRFLAGLINGAPEVAIFRHNQNGSATAARETGAIAQLRAAHPQITLRSDVYSSTEPGAESARARYLLEKYPQVGAILASGTPGTMAMLTTLRESGRSGQVHFVGFGFNLNRTVAEALRDGTMHGWIAQLPEEVGAGGVRAALALIRGETVPAVSHTPVKIITAESLSEPSVQALVVD